MQTRNNVTRIRTAAAVMALCLAAATTAIGGPLSDFEDGTLQGWAGFSSPIVGGDFEGVLDVPSTGGNPDHYMRVTDTGDGTLFVIGPDEFRGDLSVYTEVRWDEFLFENPQVHRGTGAALIGADDTLYLSQRPLAPLGVWRTRSVSFDASEWTLVEGTGTSSFEEVLSSATLALSMDVSTTTLPTIESGIDNVMLLPEPTTLVLLGMAALAMGARRRR